MFQVASAQSIREAEDRWFDAHPGEDLMGEAASHLADAAVDMLSDIAGQARVLVAIGPGNNGGDGLFAAARLARLGHRVSCWMTSPQHHLAGAAAADDAGVTRIDASEAFAWLADVDLVIDAVFGIGARPGLRGVVADFARACSDIGVAVLAADLPSGLAADSNQADASSFRATTTLTFGALKLAHVAQPAASRCGRVRVADIGITPRDEGIRVMEPADVARWWPTPLPTSDKYSRGVVGLDTGSASYPGAGVLSTLGALYSGAGMIRFVGAEESARVLRVVAPSVTFGRGRVQAWVVGSGWAERDDARARLEALLAVGAPAVIDADALRSLPARLDGCLLTPHAGELARLLGVDRGLVESDPVGAAREAARQTGATVLLKGATQYAARSDGDVLIAVGGPAWTAQAGSGDVLAGLCGTLLAAGLDAQRAGAVAASVQAIAASDRPGPFPPDDVARHVPSTIARLTEASGGIAG